jgi:hypothetical protein
MKRRLCYLLGTVVLCAICEPAWAGDCLDGDDEYVLRLEKHAKKKMSYRETDAACLLVGRMGHSTNRWAGARAARYFRSLRKSKFRKRIGKACERILGRKKFWPSRICVKLLASYGIQKQGAYDTFALQKRYVPFGMLPLELAALGDRRATAQLIERFNSDKVCTTHFVEGNRRTKYCKDFSNRDKNRWKKKAYIEHKIAVLNAMWHLADPQGGAFLKNVVGSEPSQLVRKRAGMVLKRLP